MDGRRGGGYSNNRYNAVMLGRAWRQNEIIGYLYSAYVSYLHRAYLHMSFRGQLPFRPPTTYMWLPWTAALCLDLVGGTLLSPVHVTGVHIISLQENKRQWVFGQKQFVVDGKEGGGQTKAVKNLRRTKTSGQNLFFFFYIR